MRRHAASFVHPRDRALRFQIKVLLAADLQFAFEMQGAGLEYRSIAARQPQRRGVEAIRQDRVFNGEDRRQWLVFHRHAGGAALRRFQRLSEYPDHRLAVIHHLSRKQRFIVPVGSRIALARNVARGEYGGDARF